ncbi:MAG: hypothetical protein AB1426_09650 [Bacillota bacterium]
MTIPFELIRVMVQIEGEITRMARSIIQDQKLSDNELRSQFRQAIHAAQQAGDRESLKAFLAYQTSRDNKKKIWAHQASNQLFIKRVWRGLESLISKYEQEAGSRTSKAWAEANDAIKEKLRLMLAERFFAYLERAYEIWKDAEAKRYYFDDDEQNRGGGVEGAS